MVVQFLRPRMWWGAVVCGVLPFLLARCHPWREIPAALAGTDPLMQTAILQHVTGRPIWVASTWQAPFFAPATWSLTFMDPLWGQSLLVVWVPAALRSPALTYNLCLAMTLAMAFGATVMFARVVGLARLPATLAGLVYALGPYAMGHLQHLNQLPSPWLPLSLWALIAIGADRRWGVVVWTVALLMQLVSGVYGFTAVALVNVVVIPVLVRRWDALGRLGWLAGFALVSLAVWGWSVPYREAAAVHDGFVRSAAAVGPFAARVSDLWHAPAPHLLPWPSWVPGRPVLYPGVGWGILALGALVARLRTGPRRVWSSLLVASVIGFVLALGRSHPVPGQETEWTMPLAFLQDHVWPLRALRAPARLFLPATLLIATLGALALQILWKRAATRTARIAVIGLGLVGLADLAPGPATAVRATPTAEEAEIVGRLGELEPGQTWTLLPQPCRERDEGPRDARAMLWAALSGAPLVGGTSGFVPAPTETLRRECCGAPLRCARRLREMGVALIVTPREAADPVATMEIWRGETWKLLRPLRTVAAPVR